MDGDLSIRRARADDYDAFARLFPDLEVDDPTPSAAFWSDNMVPFSWVATVGEDVVAYCYCAEYQDTGYVRNIVVARSARNRGIGQALLRATADHLRAIGKRNWRLNVKPDNAPARRLYEKMGFKVAYESVSLRFPWSSLAALQPGAAAVSVCDASRDHAVESVFALPTGQLASARTLGRSILCATDDDGNLMALAVFDRNFPGAFPFRIRQPRALLPMLLAIRAQARPDDTFVALVIENDARMVKLLLDAGASIRDEILHMRGDLPDAPG